MLVEEVDDINAKALERCFRNSAHVLGATVGTHHHLPCRFGGIDLEAELGSDDNLIAVGLQALADKDLVVIGAVNFGGVEKVTPSSTARCSVAMALFSSPAGL